MCNKCAYAKGEQCVCTCELWTDEEWENWEALVDDCPYFDEVWEEDDLLGKK